MSEYSGSYTSSSDDEAELVVGEKLPYAPKLSSERNKSESTRNSFAGSDVSSSDIDQVSDENIAVQNIPNPVEVYEADEEYEVEAVLAQRTRGRKIQYLVKWKGYAESESTWEDADHCSCAELIAEFHERERQKRAEEALKRKKLAEEAEQKRRMKQDLVPTEVKVLGVKYKDGKVVYTIKRQEDISTFSSDDVRLEWTNSIIQFWESVAVSV